MRTPRLNMPKWHLIIIGILATVLIVTTLILYYGSVKEKKMAFKERRDYYNKIIRSEQKWLAGLQQSNGALAFRDKENGSVRIVPYFSCITARALVQKAPDPKYADAASRYLDWHFEHLNDSEADKYGIAGTIYDYSAEVANGVVKAQRTEQDYDSTDSYAALFLIALWEYYAQTGNRAYLIEHHKQISDVVGAMQATVDNDGLFFAKPDKRVKYLMDNSEVFQGVSCAINLFERVYLRHYQEGTAEYQNAEQTLAQLQELKIRQEKAFETNFWNESEGRYEIGINRAGSPLNFTGWGEFYPDAVAQLFPIIFGMVEPDSERAHKLYNQFSEHYDWQSMAHYEKGYASFYWGLTAYCGALMGDEEKVRAYLKCYKSKVFPDYKYPAYNADVAWVVLASAELARYYEEQMLRVDPLGIVKT